MCLIFHEPSLSIRPEPRKTCFIKTYISSPCHLFSISVYFSMIGFMVTYTLTYDPFTTLHFLPILKSHTYVFSIMLYTLPPPPLHITHAKKADILVGCCALTYSVDTLSEHFSPYGYLCPYKRVTVNILKLCIYTMSVCPLHIALAKKEN